MGETGLKITWMTTERWVLTCERISEKDRGTTEMLWLVSSLADTMPIPFLFCLFVIYSLLCQGNKDIFSKQFSHDLKQFQVFTTFIRVSLNEHKLSHTNL